MNKVVYRLMSVMFLVALIFGGYTTAGASIAPVQLESANAYYVSVNGNDANTGTQDSPWKTIQKALTTLKAGDTAYIRGGTYVGIGGGWNFANSGTASAPITVSNYPGEAVILQEPFDDNGNSSFRCWYTNGMPLTVKKDYIRIIGTDVAPRTLSNGVTSNKGIVIQGTSGTTNMAAGVEVSGCDNWEVAGIGFSSLGYAIFAKNSAYRSTGDYSPDNWYVHDNIIYSYYSESGMQFNGSYNRIENNVFHKGTEVINQNYGCQLLNLLGHNNTVRGNEFSRQSNANCLGILLEWDISDENLVEGNTMTDVPAAVVVAGGDNNMIQNNFFTAQTKVYNCNPSPCTSSNWPWDDSETIIPAQDPAAREYSYYYPRVKDSHGNVFLNNIGSPDQPAPTLVAFTPTAVPPTASPVPVLPTVTALPPTVVMTATAQPIIPTMTPIIVEPANTYYVSGNGNDANAGTQNSPWKTIEKAVTTLKAGETVYIRGGTYVGIGGGWNFANSGTASAPITVSNYPGEAVILQEPFDDNGNSSFRCWYTNGMPLTVKKDYIRIIGTDVAPRTLSNGVTSNKGIVIQGTSGTTNMAAGMEVSGCDNWEVAGIGFSNLGYAIFTKNSAYRSIGDYSPDNWYVHDNIIYSYYSESGMQFNGSYNRIENNVFHKGTEVINQNYGCQLLNLLGHNNTVRGNEFSRQSNANCLGILLEWDISDENLVEGNTMTDVPAAVVVAGGDNNMIQNNFFTAQTKVYNCNPSPCTSSNWPWDDSETIIPADNPAAREYPYYYPRVKDSHGNVFLNNTGSPDQPAPTLVVFTPTTVPPTATPTASPDPVLPTETALPPTVPVTETPQPIIPTMTATPIPPIPTIQPILETLYDDKSGTFIYSTGWKDVTSEKSYGGSYKLTTGNNSALDFTFTGQNFSVLYKSGLAFRNMDVYVDNVLVATINQKTRKSLFQQRWDYAGILSSGTHTLRLVFVTANITDKTSGSIDAVIVR